MSGPCGPCYNIEREDEDLAAVVAETGAQRVFGTADGGLFALHGSVSIPQVRKVAVFEPVLFVNQPGVAEFRRTIARGEEFVARGDIAGRCPVWPPMQPKTPERKQSRHRTGCWNG